MVKEIIVNARRDSTRIALLEDGQLAEFHIETPDHERTIGNLYLGRVKKVMPNIRAAFVDIGERQDAFLHFSDLTDNLPLLLSFLEQDQPELGRHRIRVEARLARKKRRFGRPRRTGTALSGVQARRTAIGHLLENRHPQRRRRRQDRPRRMALPTLPRQRTLDGYLQNNQRILVKIIKEPISHKGSRVSTDISLAGRFLVLVPLADYVAVSKKISSFRERKRLRALVRSLTPDGFGVIVRTQAEGQTARALDTDLRLLVEKWRKIERHLQGRPQHPKTVYEDVNMVSSVVRDLFSEDFKRILVDEPRLFKNLKGYVQAVAPNLADCVKYHDNARPVFEAVGIEQQLRLAFDTRVPMASGGYLIIERTEAMHVVDVNSGRAGKGLSQEENALRIDLEAARTICRHLRLRDLGGIICIDFIDLRDEKNRRKVLEEIKREFKKDRAVTKVLPMSDFGIVQITRQRLRPSYTTWAGEGDRRDDSVPAQAERARDDQRYEERRDRDAVRRDRDADGARRDLTRREERRDDRRDRPAPAAPAAAPSDAYEAPAEGVPAAPTGHEMPSADGTAPRKRRRRGGRGRGRDAGETTTEPNGSEGFDGFDDSAEANASHEPDGPVVRASADAEALAASLETSTDGMPAKKRRRRGGRGRNRRGEPVAEGERTDEAAADMEEAEVVSIEDGGEAFEAPYEPVHDVPAPVVAADVLEDDAEQVTAAEAESVEDAVVLVETLTPVVAATARRPRAKKATAPVAEAAEASPEAVAPDAEAVVPAPAKRTRARKADAPPAAVSDVPEGSAPLAAAADGSADAAAPAKRTRTRKAPAPDA